jgi:dethiobiotin synthetase
MRVVVLGCGTGVGKTRVSTALLRALVSRRVPALGLKPIESGIVRAEDAEGAPPGSDAAALTDAGSLRTRVLHPLYALAAPVSPHLAARSAGVQIDLQSVATWVSDAESAVTPHVPSHSALWSVIETAGGVFSPLAPALSNFELALALEPATWVVVAADALGVLHDVSATLKAMRANGREPDHLVLSGARAPDQSTGSNAAELTTLGIAVPSAVLARDDDRGVSTLLDRLLESDRRRALTPR